MQNWPQGKGIHFCYTLLMGLMGPWLSKWCINWCRCHRFGCKRVGKDVTDVITAIKVWKWSPFSTNLQIFQTTCISIRQTCKISEQLAKSQGNLHFNRTNLQNFEATCISHGSTCNSHAATCNLIVATCIKFRALSLQRIYADYSAHTQGISDN